MPKVICMLVYADAQSLDISGPLEVFALASRQAQEDDPKSPPALPPSSGCQATRTGHLGVRHATTA